MNERDISPRPQTERELFELTSNPASLSEAFECWWAIYPRKVAKDAARKAFGKILKDKLATFAQLLEGVQAYAQAREGQDHHYTAHPTNWLRGGRWADEPAPVPLPARTRSREPWSALDQAIGGLGDVTAADDAAPLHKRMVR